MQRTGKDCLAQRYAKMITVDNGPEFIGKALDAWAHRHVKLVFNRPGKPIDNRYIESFNGRLRDKCLNVNWFMSLGHAREIIGEWREDYNSIRPHSALGTLTPEEFLAQHGYTSSLGFSMSLISSTVGSLSSKKSSGSSSFE